VEEVLGPVLGRNEAEASIGDQLLDGSKGHVFTLAPERAVTLAWWAPLLASLSPIRKTPSPDSVGCDGH
jgi:hypothetical protein